MTIITEESKLDDHSIQGLPLESEGAIVEFRGAQFDPDGIISGSNDDSLSAFIEYYCVLRNAGLLDEPDQESLIVYADDQFVIRNYLRIIVFES